VISGQVVAFLNAEEPAQVASAPALSSYRQQQRYDDMSKSSPSRLTTYLTELTIIKVLEWFKFFSFCSLEKQVQQCLKQLRKRRTEVIALPLTMTYLTGLQRTHADLLLASLA
jgi:hypothetical protein